MNIFQRIVLILGAIALVLAILTTPYIVIVQGTYAKPSVDLPFELQPMIASSTALLRAVGIVGATVLLFFALKSSGDKKKAKKVKPSK